jgi:hypothetical protein
MDGCLIVEPILTEFLPRIKVMQSKTTALDQYG